VYWDFIDFSRNILFIWYASCGQLRSATGVGVEWLDDVIQPERSVVLRSLANRRPVELEEVKR
jgi:hypothetical protein